MMSVGLGIVDAATLSAMADLFKGKHRKGFLKAVCVHKSMTVQKAAGFLAFWDSQTEVKQMTGYFPRADRKTLVEQVGRVAAAHLGSHKGRMAKNFKTQTDRQVAEFVVARKRMRGVADAIVSLSKARQKVIFGILDARGMSDKLVRSVSGGGRKRATSTKWALKSLSTWAWPNDPDRGWLYYSLLEAVWYSTRCVHIETTIPRYSNCQSARISVSPNTANSFAPTRKTSS